VVRIIFSLVNRRFRIIVTVVRVVVLMVLLHLVLVMVLEHRDKVIMVVWEEVLVHIPVVVVVVLVV